MSKRNHPLTQSEQLAQLRVSLRLARQRTLSLERQVKRMLAGNPLAEMEREVSRLEVRCEDLTRLCELAEIECLQLKRQLQLRSVA